MIFSVDETVDVGRDLGTAVSDRDTSKSRRFTGAIA